MTDIKVPGPATPAEPIEPTEPPLEDPGDEAPSSSEDEPSVQEEVPQ